MRQQTVTTNLVTNPPTSTTINHVAVSHAKGAPIPPAEFQSFEDLARKLVQVPKSEMDELRKDEQT